MAIAKDWGNEEKYAVADSRKAKLKKPLTMLLAKRGKTLPPEVMFVLVIIGVYSPVIMQAVAERKRKTDAENLKQENQRKAQVIKKKGRPKGSKDSKPRKPKTIIINSDEKNKGKKTDNKS